MLEELAGAIEKAAWPRALVLALDAWRAARSPALADLVDALAARCPRAPAPRRDQHGHWMTAALAYEPVAACALFDTVHLRLHKGDSDWPAVLARLGADDPVIARIVAIGLHHFKPVRYHTEDSVRELPTHQRNRVERLAALARWPVDPRVATVLAQWFAHDGFAWQWPHEHGAGVMLEVMAEQLARIGDPRCADAIADCIERPRARTPHLRTIQQQLARRIVDALAPVPDDPRVVAWVRALAPPVLPPSVDEDALWHAIAREPASNGPRMVLADALIERGDRRGELFTLQCADDPKLAPIADQLVALHWNAWLGDLALVIKRGDSWFERGMLVKAVVGLESTPAWAYGAVGRHRELTSLTRFAPGRYIGAAAYATFLASLVATPLAEVELAISVLDELAQRRPQWDVRALRVDLYDVSHGSMSHERFVQAIDRIVALFPTLETIAFTHWNLPDPYPATLHRLRALPALHRIALDHTHWLDAETQAVLARLAETLPIVVLA